MRNILEYPPTLQEIVKALSYVKDDLEKKDKEELSCGNMQAFLVGKASELIAELESMIAHAPQHLPVLPENPTPYDLEYHGVALTDYAYAEMVKKTLNMSLRIDMEMPTDK